MAPPTKKERQRRRRQTLRPHPLRDQIVDALRSCSDPLSPARLAEITGATLGAVAYHVRTLAEAGVVEIAREGRVRGAVEHFYALSPDEDATQLGDPLTTLLALCGGLTQPAGNGRLPTPTVLDDQAREELQRLLDQLRPKVRKAAAAAAARSATTKPAARRAAGGRRG